MNYEPLLLSRVRGAAQEFDMISDGERVLCAVSGGKDSLSLCSVLKKLSAFYPRAFTLGAVMIDMGFEGFDAEPLYALFDSLGVPFTTVKTDIARVAEGEKPCSLCSRLRRGALCNYAEANGYTALALGHTEDDCAQTAIMNLLFCGKFESFEPVTRYEDRNIKLIRPLITTPEKLTAALRRVSLAFR